MSGGRAVAMPDASTCMVRCCSRLMIHAIACLKQKQHAEREKGTSERLSGGKGWHERCWCVHGAHTG